MKKIFSIIILTTMIFFCGQNNIANAQDVYAGNTGGLDFYVDTNTIVPTGKPDGFVYYAFYVNVKKVEQDTGRLRDINQWKFYTANLGGDIESWVFDYYLSGTRIPVVRNQIASNILKICRQYDSRIAG